MFLALLLSVAMADTLTLDSGARLVGELASYEQGGNCYISVTDGDLKGSIVVVMCDQIQSFERAPRVVAEAVVATEPPVVAEPPAEPVAEPIAEEVLPLAAPVQMEAMEAPPAPEAAAAPDEILASAEPMDAPAPEAPDAIVTGTVTVDPVLADPAPPAAAPAWRSSAPPPVGARPGARVPSTSRAPTERAPAVNEAPPANAYAQPMEGEGNVGW